MCVCVCVPAYASVCVCALKVKSLVYEIARHPAAAEAFAPRDCMGMELAPSVHVYVRVCARALCV